MSKFSESGWESESDEYDSLDELLDRAPVAQPDPWFAARTMALCRGQKHVATWSLLNFIEAWRWALGSGITACMVIALFAAQVRPTIVPVKQQDVQDAFQIVASIDADAESSTTSTGQEDSL